MPGVPNTASEAVKNTPGMKASPEERVTAVVGDAVITEVLGPQGVQHRREVRRIDDGSAGSLLVGEVEDLQGEDPAARRHRAAIAGRHEGLADIHCARGLSLLGGEGEIGCG